MASPGACAIFKPLTSRKYQASNSLDPSSPIKAQSSNTNAIIVRAKISDIGITGRLRRLRRARNDRGGGRAGQTETRPLLGSASLLADRNGDRSSCMKIKGCDVPALPMVPRRRSIQPRIARRGVGSRQCPERRRWVMDRTRRVPPLPATDHPLRVILMSSRPSISLPLHPTTVPSGALIDRLRRRR